MIDDPPEPGQDETAWGLCATCRHARVTRNDRGSRFVLCERSKTDPRFPRYPAVPVKICFGCEPRVTDL